MPAHSVVLTPSAQRVYLQGVTARVFSTDDALAVLANKGTARKVVLELVRKGYARRVFRGLYVAVPPEYLEAGYEPDRYLIANKIIGEVGSLAYHSALELHGVAQSSFNTVYAISPRRIAPFSFYHIEYRFVLTPDVFGQAQVTREGVKVSVTDKERTIVDCIRRVDLAGGLEELLKSIEGFRLVNTDRIAQYLDRIGEKGLVQRTGFILSTLRDKMRIPDEFLSGLKVSVSPRPYYLVPRMKPGTGRIDKTWNVIVPRNLGEVMRFA